MENARYFLIDGPPDAVAKIEEDSAYRWSEDGWQRDSWAARKISAYDGEDDARPISSEEAQHIIHERK
jgi:hypothetical protein